MQPLSDRMLYADLRDADLARKLAALTPVPGYCACVDLVGCTGLKAAGLGVCVTATLDGKVDRAHVDHHLVPPRVVGESQIGRACRVQRRGVGARGHDHGPGRQQFANTLAPVGILHVQ